MSTYSSSIAVRVPEMARRTWGAAAGAAARAASSQAARSRHATSPPRRSRSRSVQERPPGPRPVRSSNGASASSPSDVAVGPESASGPIRSALIGPLGREGAAVSSVLAGHFLDGPAPAVCRFRCPSRSPAARQPEVPGGVRPGRTSRDRRARPQDPRPARSTYATNQHRESSNCPSRHQQTKIAAFRRPSRPAARPAPPRPPGMQVAGTGRVCISSHMEQALRSRCRSLRPQRRKVRAEPAGPSSGSDSARAAVRSSASGSARRPRFSSRSAAASRLPCGSTYEDHPRIASSTASMLQPPRSVRSAERGEHGRNCGAPSRPSRLGPPAQTTHDLRAQPEPSGWRCHSGHARRDGRPAARPL